MKKHLLLIILLSLPAAFSLLKPGYYNMHDDMQMVRQLEMEKCLKDGQIPCRWTPDLGYGYGYPLFNFYPPVPYLVGQVYRTLGFSFMWSVKLTAVTQIILSSIFMFFLALEVFGPLGGVLSSIFYTYAPYHAVNIYVRGAMNEAWASVFFPLIFLYSRRLILKNRPIDGLFFALSFAGLSLSHNPMVLTFTPILAAWCLFWFLTKPQKKSVIWLLISSIFSIMLTAFFVFPVLFESKFVQIESMFINYYHYSVHFVTFKELFISSFWGDGPSVWGPNDGMAFMIGYLHWVIPTLIILIILVIIISKKHLNRRLILSSILIILGFFTTFLTHNKSTFIWQIFPSIQKIQFPWRFLSHTTFLFPLSIGVLPILYDKYSSVIRHTITLLLLGLVILINLNYFHPIQSGPLTDNQKFSGLAWQNQITSGIYDYLPKTAAHAPTSVAQPIIDSVDNQSQAQITGLKKGTNWSLFNLSLTKPSNITLALLYFPGYKVFDFGTQIQYGVEPKLGRLTINLSAGNHQIYAKLYDSPIRSIGNLISLIAWSLVIITVLRYLWMKLAIKK